MAAVTARVVDTPFVDRPTTLSVVISADSLDQWDDLDRTLASLHRQTRRADQIVVVVDHHDQLLEWAADAWSMRGERAEPVVDVIANTRARGQAGARNTGIEWCHGDVVAFLDPGALTADLHWIETMFEDYAQGDVAGVGGGAAPDWGRDDAPPWLPDEFAWAIGCSHPGLPADVGEVDSLLGANMSFRREVFTELGGFDSGAAGASDELCVRIRRRYPLARLLHDPDLVVVHRMTDEARSFAGYRQRCFEEGRSAASIARAAGPDRDLVPTRPFSAIAPRGVVRGLGDGVRGRLAGFQQAGALVVGVAWAAGGYFRGRLAPGA